MDSLCNFGFKNIGLPPGFNNEWFPGPQDAVGGLIYVFQIWAGHLSCNSFAWIVQPYTIDWTECSWTELRLRAVSKVQTSSWLSDGSGQILLGVKNLYSWLKRKTVAFICRRPVKNRLGTKSWLIYWMKDSKSWFLLMKWNLFLQIVVHILDFLWSYYTVLFWYLPKKTCLGFSFESTINIFYFISTQQDLAIASAKSAACLHFLDRL